MERRIELLTLFFVFLVPPALSLKSDWSQEMRDHILEAHNTYRQNEGGCRINKLVYDLDLEKKAKRWVEKCAFKHESDGFGENLAWDTNTIPEKELIGEATKAWFDEKADFTFGVGGSCGKACHYTQMVWDSTEAVGCYSTRCPNLERGAANAWFLACWYDPRGNWGDDPYSTSCKTPCRKGQNPDNGVCTGIATCEDNKPDCENWAKQDQCAVNPAFMEKNCIKACGVCDRKSRNAWKKSNEKSSGARCRSDTKVIAVGAAAAAVLSLSARRIALDV